MNNLQISYRRAKHEPDRVSGKPVMQEIYSFGEQAQQAKEKSQNVAPPDPFVVICERLSQCTEGIVAECKGEIIGAVTLAFEGVDDHKKPTLDGVLVKDGFRGQGIGYRLVELAMETFVAAEKTPVFCKAVSEGMCRLLERLRQKRPDLHEKMEVWQDTAF